MKAVHNAIDSVVFGAPFFDLEDFDPEADFEGFERNFLAQESPRYIGCKVPIESVAEVQRLESLGFGFLEVQFRSVFKLRRPFETSSYPYTYSEVTSDPSQDRAEVLAIAESTFVHDRFSNDPELTEKGAGERYRRFVEKSIDADDEFAYKLVNPASGETVGFHTYKHTGGKEALFLIAGVKAEYKSLGLGTVLNYFALNEMYDRGVRKIVTHQSASNYPILNLEIGHFNFKIVQAYVALRKVYE